MMITNGHLELQAYNAETAVSAEENRIPNRES